MNKARIVVLALAMVAAGAAVWLASGSEPQPQVVQAPAVKLDTIEVLVARADINLGQTVTAGEMQWQTWPMDGASASFIKRADRPDAVKQLTGTIARSPFAAGEPIRETKLVQANGSGFMAAILPTGMRAVSTEISPETGAGGFILPNDRVDVILSRRVRGDGGATETGSSEILLTNVRVLAIDQTIAEKDGQKVVVGKTATIEVKPEQAETLARARQSGVLSLALRSLADASATDQGPAGRDSVNVIRFGVSTSSTSK